MSEPSIVRQPQKVEGDIRTFEGAGRSPSSRSLLCFAAVPGDGVMPLPVRDRPRSCCNLVRDCAIPCNGLAEMCSCSVVHTPPSSYDSLFSGFCVEGITRSWLKSPELIESGAPKAPQRISFSRFCLLSASLYTGIIERLGCVVHCRRRSSSSCCHQTRVRTDFANRRFG